LGSAAETGAEKATAENRNREMRWVFIGRRGSVRIFSSEWRGRRHAGVETERRCRRAGRRGDAISSSVESVKGGA